MNQVWFIAFIAWTVAMFGGGFEYESHRAGEKSAELETKQQTITIDAEKNVIAKQQNAESITTNTEQSYEKTVDRINVDDDDGVQPSGTPASSSMPAIPVPAARTCPIAVTTSKTYKLTFRQCDIEEAKLQAFWAWYVNQRQ